MDSCDLTSEENERGISTALGRIASLNTACARCADSMFLRISSMRCLSPALGAIASRSGESEAKARRHHKEQDNEGRNLTSIHPQESNLDPLMSHGRNRLELRQASKPVTGNNRTDCSFAPVPVILISYGNEPGSGRFSGRYT